MEAWDYGNLHIFLENSVSDSRLSRSDSTALRIQNFMKKRLIQTDGGEYGLEVSAAAVVNAVRQPVVVVAEADMAAVAVELGDQLVFRRPVNR